MVRGHERLGLAGTGTKGARMNFQASLSRPWKRGLTIRRRFGLGVGVLLFLSVAMTSVILIGRYHLRDAERNMADSLELQRLVLKMDQGMEKARRLHADFFLHAPEIGFAAAHERYAQPSARKIAEVVTLSKALKELIGRSHVGEGIRDSQVEVNLYLSSAKRFADTSIEAVEFFTGLHVLERGLEPRLTAVLDEMTSVLNPKGESFRLLAEMKSRIQQYRIARQRPLMQHALNAEFRLRQSLSSDPLVEERERRQMDGLLNRFRELADGILTSEAAIRSRFNDFALQSVAVERVSGNLESLAAAEVERSRQRIQTIRGRVVHTALLMTLAGAVAAFLVIRMMNRSIIQPVSRLTRLAGELRQGNLDVVIPEDSGDELGQLGRTFNLVTGRIRELVGTLESQVERRTAELAASEQRFRQLFESSGDGMMICEACDEGGDFVIRDCNRALETIELRACRDLIGRRVTKIFPGIEKAGLLSVMRRVWEGGQPERLPATWYADGVVQGWREYGVHRLFTGEVVCVHIDRTAQKQAEEESRRMEARLQSARKMETLGLMAGGVAHDLNNILSGVVGFPDILLMNLPQDSALREPIGIIKDSGQRAAAVVADLLTVARGAVGRREAADLNTLVRNYLASPEHLALASRHPLEGCASLPAANLPPILCSPVHIGKCVMNLVSNAMESIDGPGHVTIATMRQMVAEPLASQNNVSPGEYAVLSVADTGKGIAEKDLEHIFEPFYSKKVMGISGTGLGLAVVWNSVVDHGGMIRVESGGRGTTFSLFFPVSSQVAEAGTAELPPVELGGRGESILVVDDEPMLRELAATLLQRLGYTVSCAASGEEAVAWLREHPADLVLLDMVMDPGMNGLATYREMLQVAPRQKAIVVSGFAEGDDVKAVQALGATRFVKKPYSLEQLGRAVRAELG